jgi:hypothetical protein
MDAGIIHHGLMAMIVPASPHLSCQPSSWRITGSQDKWVTTPSWTVLKITGSGDDYTAESLVKYPDGGVWHAVDFFRFREGRILHQIAYFAAPLEAPEWRARWVERF